MPNKTGKNFSCNNSKGQRKKSDFYETPYSITQQLLDVLEIEKDSFILEPACGGGAITKVLELNNFSNLESYDIEKDFLKEERVLGFDYVITNPPFSLAKEFILKSKEVCRKGFYMLLPLSYLHGKERHDIIYQNNNFMLKTVYVFTRYPMLGDKLRDDGKYRTGMMVYAWFYFENGFVGDSSIKWIDNNSFVLNKKDT